jgi:hypothetical protein
MDIWTEGGDVLVDCFFRDSHQRADGPETIVHEYTLHVAVDPDSMLIRSCAAGVGALPWPECPSAAASAHRLVGTPLTDLRQRVRAEFVGPSTCTHLNDTLRSLADVPALLARIA